MKNLIIILAVFAAFTAKANIDTVYAELNDTIYTQKDINGCETTIVLPIIQNVYWFVVTEDLNHVTFYIVTQEYPHNNCPIQIDTFYLIIGSNTIIIDTIATSIKDIETPKIVFQNPSNKLSLDKQYNIQIWGLNGLVYKGYTNRVNLKRGFYIAMIENKIYKLIIQ